MECIYSSASGNLRTLTVFFLSNFVFKQSISFASLLRDTFPIRIVKDYDSLVYRYMDRDWEAKMLLTVEINKGKKQCEF